MSIEFLMVSLVVILVPGTGVLYTLAYGLSRGAAASAVAAFGCTLGIMPHIAAAVFGMAALLHASAVAFQAVKFLGVAYLLYLAWGALKEKGVLSVDEKADNKPWPGIVLKGFLINILNPKLSIFFLAFLPQFVAPDNGGVAVQMLVLGAAFMLMTFAAFVVYGLFAAWVRGHVISRPGVMTWMRRAFAGTFLALGLKLALAERETL
ncbi:MAG: LysE family translocator [Rhodospirillales bacterium]